MISSLRGVVTYVESHSCVVEVGGVGYQVFITSRHASKLADGHETSMFTALIVREDSMTLYGFEALDEREIFDSLLSVSGVGPRSALAVLNELSAMDIINAVIEEQDELFRKVSGIGPKTAKLIVVQLSGKLNLAQSTVSSSSAHNDSLAHDKVIQALVGLGWNEKSAKDATQQASSDAPDDAAKLLKSALAILSGNKT